MPKIKRIRPYSADERVADVGFSEDSLTVSLMDGRSICVPLVWYPRLLHATTAQRTTVEKGLRLLLEASSGSCDLEGTFAGAW